MLRKKYSITSQYSRKSKLNSVRKRSVMKDKPLILPGLNGFSTPRAAFSSSNLKKNPSTPKSILRNYSALDLGKQIRARKTVEYKDKNARMLYKIGNFGS